jgi:hypothetical protein
MVLKDIMTISGEPGLFRFIAQGKNSIIIEHLETKKRSSAFGTAKVSSLEDIAIFTENEDIPLSKVFDLIWDKSDGGQAIDGKADGTKLKNWFEDILPGYDKDRVYTSDIKKVALWFNILHKLNLLVKEEAEEAKTEETEKVEEKEKAAPAKKKKKPSAPKAEKK